MKDATLKRLVQALETGEASSVEIVADCLERAERSGKDVNAFLHVDSDDVTRRAEESDARRAAGQTLSPWDGIPVGIKDNIAVKGQPCRCASKILEPFVSPYDAKVVERLAAAGMIPFGRANMDEFAMGSSCENSAFGPTRNPRGLDRVPGGSSGGSAAAVAAGLVPVALGSDTGGSIRQPAAFCGVVGMKPTYGRVSRYGLVAFASSLDQIGPLANNVEDAAVLLDIVSGSDAKDSTSLPNASTGCAKALEGAETNLKGVKVGLPKEYFAMEGVDSGVEKSIADSIELFKSLGAEMVEVSLPTAEYAVSAYYVIATAEASANLARFDGIRYGARAENAESLIDTYLRSRGEGFGEEVKRRILLGTFVLSTGYHDAYYLRALKARTLFRRDLDAAFANCDIMLSPTSPTVAFKLEEKTDDPLKMYLADIFTIAVNLTGCCAMSLPSPTLGEGGLPVGVQLMAPPMADETLFRVARTFERSIGGDA
jgi:aspartyl-tRNA(Asn)/glutamyl-tRNA(Gln) amidotransferase subunit A